MCKLDAGTNCSVMEIKKLHAITDKKEENYDIVLKMFIGHQKKATRRN